MSVAVVISDATGRRELDGGRLPLKVGTGSQSDIRLPGPVTAAIYAYIGLLDERPFLQRADAEALSVNGEAVSGSRWLAEGDDIEIGSAHIRCRIAPGQWLFEVGYAGVDYTTLPPEELKTAESELPPAPVATTGRTRSRFQRGPRAILVYAGLGLLAAIAAVLLTSEAVFIGADPPVADIEVLSHPDLHLNERYLLWPGTRAVRIEAPGYRPQQETLTVTRAPNQEFRFRLEKLPGRLVLTTVPEVAGTVAIDGRPAGTVPGPGLELPPGLHQIKLSAPRYQPFEQSVQVEGGGVAQTLEIALVPDFAAVQVTSSPAGAAVFVDGEAAGTTPAKLDLASGQRELKLEKDGFKTLTRSVVVTAGQPQDLGALTLAPADGLVRISSGPPGAAVTVEGRYRGLTPLEVELPPGRRYTVELVKAGYEAASAPVDLTATKGATLRVDLVPRLGVVRVKAEPADAELVVDGRVTGVAGAAELSLPAVEHVIEVRKAGFETYTARVTPEPGQPRVLAVRLLTPTEAAAAAPRQVVTATSGQEMVLVQPGSFRMGAPRREQGRRANETERDVVLTRPYFLGAREVTNRQFREFRPNHTSGAEKYRELAGGNHPAVMLSWEDAAAYCNFLSDKEGLPKAYVNEGGRYKLAVPVGTGYRLPTEAEWEWAARYGGGTGLRKYPWGAQMPPEKGAGNFADRSARSFVAATLEGYDDGQPVTAPVGQFAANALGLFDLGGNAAEWVNDFYTVAPAGSEAVTDPLGPEEGQYHGIRGSSWRHGSISELRLSYRDFGDMGRLDVGFRLARYAGPPAP